MTQSQPNSELSDEDFFADAWEQSVAQARANVAMSIYGAGLPQAVRDAFRQAAHRGKLLLIGLGSLIVLAAVYTPGQYLGQAFGVNYGGAWLLGGVIGIVLLLRAYRAWTKKWQQSRSRRI